MTTTTTTTLPDGQVVRVTLTDDGCLYLTTLDDGVIDQDLVLSPIDIFNLINTGRVL